MLAMAHGLPGGAQVIYKLRVLPTSKILEDHVLETDVTGGRGFAPLKPPFQRLALDYAVDPHDLTFTLTPDGLYHCNVEVVALAYDFDGLVAVAHADVLNGSITPIRFATVTRGGFRIHQEISVPAYGRYTLRTGIHDVRSKRIGALEIPIAAIRALPPSTTPTAAPQGIPKN